MSLALGVFWTMYVFLDGGLSRFGYYLTFVLPFLIGVFILRNSFITKSSLSFKFSVLDKVKLLLIWWWIIGILVSSFFAQNRFQSIIPGIQVAMLLFCIQMSWHYFRKKVILDFLLNWIPAVTAVSMFVYFGISLHLMPASPTAYSLISTRYEHSYLVYLLTLGIPLIFSSVVWRWWLNRQSKWLFQEIAVILMFIALIHSSSRLFLFSILGVCLLLFLRILSFSKISKIKISVLKLSFILLSLGILLVGLLTLWSSRFSRTVDFSHDPRFSYVLHAISVWKSSPIIGVGVDGIAPTLYWSELSISNQSPFAHNTFIQWLVELGLFGVLPGFILIVITTFQAIFVLRQNIYSKYWGLVCVWIVSVITGFAHIQWSFPAIIFPLLFISWVLPSWEGDSTSKLKFESIFKLLNGAAYIAVILFVLLYLFQALGLISYLPWERGQIQSYLEKRTLEDQRSKLLKDYISAEGQYLPSLIWAYEQAQIINDQEIKNDVLNIVGPTLPKQSNSLSFQVQPIALHVIEKCHTIEPECKHLAFALFQLSNKDGTLTSGNQSQMDMMQKGLQLLDSEYMLSQQQYANSQLWWTYWKNINTFSIGKNVSSEQLSSQSIIDLPENFWWNEKIRKLPLILTTLKQIKQNSMSPSSEKFTELVDLAKKTSLLAEDGYNVYFTLASHISLDAAKIAYANKDTNNSFLALKQSVLYDNWNLRAYEWAGKYLRKDISEIKWQEINSICRKTRIQCD